MSGTERDITLIIQVMFIDRHDWDSVIKIDRAGRKWTRLEEIQKSVKNGHTYHGRMDIMLINLWEGNYKKHLDQWIVEPTRSGEPEYGNMPSWIKDRLSKADHKRLKDMNKAILAVAKQHNIPIEKVLYY